jgi:hypothetical protein
LNGQVIALIHRSSSCFGEWWSLEHDQGARPDAVPDRDPSQTLWRRFLIEETRDQITAMRAVTANANNFLYRVRTNQLARGGPRQTRAPTLILSSQP